MNGLKGLMDPKSGLFQRFLEHPKIIHDEKTDLWSYKVGLGADPA